jgi:glycosyltransferase involved in cell wall biosynthesis
MRKIKILHLNAGTKLGGTETMLLRFLDKVDRNQFEVYIGAFFPGGQLLDEANKRKANTILLNNRDTTSLFRILNGFVKLYKFLKKNRIDIIQIYGFWTNIGGRIAAKLAKVPVVITGQRTEDSWRKPIHSFLDRFTSRWVDLYISVFNKGKELLIKRDRIPERKIVVVHNGIDLNWTNQVYRNNVNFPTIGMVAAFNQFKTQEVLIQAAPKIMEKFLNAKFILTGCGNTEKKMSEMINNLGLNSQFTLPGFIKDIRQILSQIDIFVLATRTEGLPVSILEAMAIGIPVVASNVGGILELIDNGNTGILVEPYNSEQLASAIIEILQNPERASRMGKAAKERVKKYFTIEQMIARLETIYLNLAMKKGSS